MLTVILIALSFFSVITTLTHSTCVHKLFLLVYGLPPLKCHSEDIGLDIPYSYITLASD